MPTSFLVADDTSTPFTSGSSGVAVVRATATPYAGSPIGALAGVVGNLVMNTTNNTLWECTSSGSSGQSQWLQVLTDPGLYALLAGANVFTQPQTINVATGFTGKTFTISLAGTLLAYLDQAGNFTSLGGGTFAGPVTAQPASSGGQVAVVGETNTGGIGFTGDISSSGAATLASLTVPGATALNGGATVPNASAAQNPVTLTQVQSGGIVTGGGIAGGTITGGNIAGSTITEGNMASGSIHRAQLSTATAATEIAIGPNANYNFAMIGGAYSFHGVSATGSGSGTNSLIVVFGGGGNAGLGYLGFLNSATAGDTEYAWINENYINSSPPYNCGEAFVYVAYDKDGKIVGISAALDPCWAHHGSHSIVPTHRSLSGKPMIMLDSLDGKILADALKDPAIKRAYLKGELEITQEEHEITIAYKDQDKEEYPHPFGSDSVARVVLMHPDSPCNNRITDLLKKGFASEIVKLIEDGDLIFKGTGVMHPYAPSTVLAVRAKVR